MKVIAFTPAGRKRYMKILALYVLRDLDSGILDGWQIWKNTINPDDVKYIDYLGTLRDEITIVDGFDIISENHLKHFSMHQFFRYLVELDIIYIRLDDDIVYIHPDAIENIVKFRVDNPSYFIVLGNIINNAVISYIQQQRGLYSKEYGEVSYHMHDPLTMFSKDHQFTQYVHRMFFHKHEEESLKDYYFDKWDLAERSGCSVNFFAVFGKDLAPVWNQIHGVPEEWFVWGYPEKTGMMNAVCGKALVSHFSFRSQEKILLETDILSEYENLMIKEIGKND